MKTRAIILFTAILFAGFNLNAQDEDRTSFGIRVGLDFQNINGKDMSGAKLDNSLVTRFNAGVNVEFPVAPDFYLQPGLLFTTKGTKMNEVSPLVGDSTNTYNLSYIELPVNFLYKPVLGAGRLIAGFGPYFAYGIGGKVTTEVGGNSEDYDVVYQNEVSAADRATDNHYFRPLDFGVNLMAGYEFANRLSFQLNTQWGLANISPEYEGVTNDESRMAHTGFGISLGFRF